jgi:hypothetical protein
MNKQKLTHIYNHIHFDLLIHFSLSISPICDDAIFILNSEEHSVSLALHDLSLVLMV